MIKITLGKYLSMRNHFIIVVLFLLSGWSQAEAQIRRTKETKVVLMVNTQSGTVSHILFLNTFQKMKKEVITKKYPNCRFYIGLLEGSYELAHNDLIPRAETTIIIYTEKQIFPEDDFLIADELLYGDEIHLGKIRAKVISNKKGELIVKTI